MTTDLVTQRPPRPATPGQLSWLTTEIQDWRAEGLIADDQAERILGHYVATRRVSVARLLLGIGSVFVGVGLIWLVAANLDQLAPLTRFGVVTFFWLALLVGAEVLHERYRQPAPVVGAVRLLAALAFGAVVFQAAQSLQVPAYSPALVGCWGAGALLHAYAIRTVGPLLVGIAAGTGWLVWQVLWESPSPLAGLLAAAAGGVVAAAAAALHERSADGFAAPWRVAAALLLLGSLFTAALPFVDTGDFVWSPWLVAGLAVAGAASTLSVARTHGSVRLEPLGAVALTGLAVLLVLWEAGDDPDVLGLADWAHAGLSVSVYAVAAVGIAALGTLRDSRGLTALATAALVVFTTFQAFAVFAAIIQGAWLFVLLGLVFLGTGLVFDRARRGLVATLEDNTEDNAKDTMEEER